jgi:hypothetical protein
MQQCEQIQLTSHIADFLVLAGKEGHYDQMMHSHSELATTLYPMCADTFHVSWLMSDAELNATGKSRYTG